jgi:hypothetical protein
MVEKMKLMALWKVAIAMTSAYGTDNDDARRERSLDKFSKN